MNYKKVHAKNAKKDAKKPEPNFALLCGLSGEGEKLVLVGELLDNKSI